MQNPSVKNADGKVEPFSLNGNRDGLKRNFTNMQEQKGYQRNEFDKLADEQRMKEHRKLIEQQKLKNQKYKHQVRKSIGHPDHTGHSQQSDVDPHRRERQRMRSQSQDRQQPMQPHKSHASRRSPSEPREMRHGHQHASNQSNRVDGSKRYMHSQQPHEFSRKDQQFTHMNGG